MQRRWIVAGVLAAVAGAAVVCTTLDHDASGPFLAAGRTVAARPMVWHGHFETAGARQARLVCDRVLAGTPDLSAGYESPHHPIQTGHDWLAYGPHAYGHWSNCREALYSGHFGPALRFRKAQPARVSYLDGVQLGSLQVTELPAAVWFMEPFAELEGERHLLQYYPHSRVTKRAPRELVLAIAGEPDPGFPHARPDWCILTESGRADFDGDGREDILFHFRRGYGEGSGFSWGHCVVSRTSPDGALEWRVETEGAH